MMQPLFSTKSSDKASGMGLNIAKTFVEEHGGTLTYDRSSPHTRFVVTLAKAASRATKKAS